MINIIEMTEYTYDILNITTWFEFYTKILTTTYVLMSAYVLSEFVSKSYYLIKGKKSKRTYFFIYVFVFILLYIQTLLLLTSPVNEHADKAILVLFIYTTALMILFLIFLALTSSETYQNLQEYTYENKEEGYNTLAGFIYFSFILFLYFKIFFYDISLNLYNNLNEKIWIKNFFNLVGNQRKLTESVNLSNTETHNYLNRSFLSSKNTVEISNIVKNHSNIWAINRQPKFIIHGSGFNIDSVFVTLRAEVVHTYVEYFISGLLQALGLIFIIGSMIV